MAKVNENETIETYRWLTQMERGQNVLFGLRSGMNTIHFKLVLKIVVRLVTINTNVG